MVFRSVVLRLAVRKLVPLIAVSAACTRGSPADGDHAERIEVWAHAGQESERATLEGQVQRFNGLQDSIHVEITFLPEGSYNAQVQASAVAGQLPDLLDLDGPYVAQYAWQGRLRPLAGLLPDSVLRDVLPSIIEQGTWRNELYAVGTFDSGLGLYGRRSALEAAGARVPTTPDDAWTARELTSLLERLSRADPDGAVLDLKLNYRGEWFTYAFQPALQSAGGGLVEWTDERPVASGTLNGESSLGVLETLQKWITAGYVDPNLDDAAFPSGRVALSWSGHWDFPRYREALGEDLVILPLPDWAGGARTGQGSWTWAIPANSTHARAAASFLSFLLQPAEILEMSGANGAVPGTRSAAARSPRYGPEGPLRLLLQQLEGGWAVSRPRTPAYAFISSVFQGLFDAVRDGEALRPLLDRAATTIDREVLDNRGYPDT